MKLLILFPLVTILLSSLPSYAKTSDPDREWNDCLDRAPTVSSIADCNQAMYERINLGISKLAARVANKVIQQGASDEAIPNIVKAIEHYGEYSNLYCRATETSDSKYMACMILALKLQGRQLLNSLESEQEVKEDTPPIVKYPVKYAGKAPGKGSDFRKIAANVDMAEYTEALAKCPKGQLETHPCVHDVSLVTAEWIHRAGFSVDEILKMIFDENSKYGTVFSIETGDTFLTMFMSVKSEEGRQKLLENGYIRKETVQMIASKSKKK